MKPTVTVVSAAYNEEIALPEFINQLFCELEKLDVIFEIIICNDGSEDKTKELLSGISNQDSRITVINFSRNFGQHAAISAGVLHARGEYIVVMDCDLQDDPSIIRELLNEAKAGTDIVFVARTNREASYIYRSLQRLFYFILNLVSELSFDPRIGNFSIINRRVQKAYKELQGSIIYYPAALKWLGFKTSVVTAKQKSRNPVTRSRYNLLSRLKLALQVIVMHSRKPLKFAIVIGTLIALLGVILSFVILWMYLNDNLNQPGWASLMVSIISLSGIQLFTLGIFGLYIGEIFDLSGEKPQYIIIED